MFCTKDGWFVTKIRVCSQLKVHFWEFVFHFVQINVHSRILVAPAQKPLLHLFRRSAAAINQGCVFFFAFYPSRRVSEVYSASRFTPSSVSFFFCFFPRIYLLLFCSSRRYANVTRHRRDRLISHEDIIQRGDTGRWDGGGGGGTGGDAGRYNRRRKRYTENFFNINTDRMFSFFFFITYQYEHVSFAKRRRLCVHRHTDRY